MREFTVRSKAVFLSGGGGGGPICYLCFILIISLNYAVLTLSCGLVVTCWDWLASCAWCFLVVCLPSHVVPGSGVVLGCIILVWGVFVKILHFDFYANRYVSI